MRGWAPVVEAVRAVRELEPARRAARRMGSLLILALGAFAGVSSAEQASSSAAASDPLFLALVGFVGSLIGAGAAVAAAWGAQRQIVRTLEGQVGALFRKWEVAADERSRIRERLVRLETRAGFEDGE